MANRAQRRKQKKNNIQSTKGMTGLFNTKKLNQLAVDKMIVTQIVLMGIAFVVIAGALIVTVLVN